MTLQEIFSFNYGWPYLMWLSILFLGGYLLLIFIKKIIIHITFPGTFRVLLKRSLEIVLVLYEPVTFLVLACVFVMIHPGFHGLMVGLALLLSFTHIRNYVHGRFMKTYNSLQPGRLITFEHQEGIIVRAGRFGIDIRRDQGLHYLPYHELITKGYILSSGDQIGIYYNLSIRPKKDDEENRLFNELSDILMSSPYVDGDHKPEIGRSISSDGKRIVRLLVREEGHVYDLISLLEENGYLSEITKS